MLLRILIILTVATTVQSQQASSGETGDLSRLANSGTGSYKLTCETWENAIKMDTKYNGSYVDHKTVSTYFRPGECYRMDELDTGNEHMIKIVDGKIVWCETCPQNYDPKDWKCTPKHTYVSGNTFKVKDDKYQTQTIVKSIRMPGVVVFAGSNDCAPLKGGKWQDVVYTESKCKTIKESRRIWGPGIGGSYGWISVRNTGGEAQTADTGYYPTCNSDGKTANVAFYTAIGDKCPSEPGEGYGAKNKKVDTCYMFSSASTLRNHFGVSFLAAIFFVFKLF